MENKATLAGHAGDLLNKSCVVAQKLEDVLSHLRGPQPSAEGKSEMENGVLPLFHTANANLGHVLKQVDELEHLLGVPNLAPQEAVTSKGRKARLG